MWKSFFVLAVLFPALVTASSEDREWTDSTGVFTVEASFVELDGKTVLLRKPNGVVVEVPLERFSEADKRYLSSLPGVDVPPTNEAIDRIERARQKVGIRLRGYATGRRREVPCRTRGNGRPPGTGGPWTTGDWCESPVTMQNKARPLAEVLPVMLLPFRLTWIVRDDVLLITSVTEVESSRKPACTSPGVKRISRALREEMKARLGRVSPAG